MGCKYTVKFFFAVPFPNFLWGCYQKSTTISGEKPAGFAQEATVSIEDKYKLKGGKIGENKTLRCDEKKLVFKWKGLEWQALPEDDIL